MSDKDKPNPMVEDDGDTAVQASEPKTKQPPLYKVVLHNDDYTPMEFVVEVLTTYFSLSREQAVQIMLTVHTRGKGAGLAALAPNMRANAASSCNMPISRRSSCAPIWQRKTAHFSNMAGSIIRASRRRCWIMSPLRAAREAHPPSRSRLPRTSC